MEKILCAIGVLFAIPVIILYIHVYKYFNKHEKEGEVKVFDETIVRKVRILLGCMVCGWVFNIIGFIVYLIKNI